MSRSLRIHLIVLAIVGAVVAAPFLIPLSAYRGSLERAASAALSREVHIKGPLHLTVYPDIGISLSDVSVASVPDARDPQMIGIETLIVGAKLMPLFSGRLEVTELTLEKPAIHLEVRKDGTANWTFGSLSSSGKAADPAALNRIGFSHLNIKDGTITYHDAASGKAATLSDVSLSLDMQDTARPTLSRPLTIGGTLTYNGEELKIAGRLDNFGQLLNAKTTGARISIQSNVINAEFTGQFGTEGSLSGALKLGAHSVRSFAAWLNSPLPPGNGFGLVALEGQFIARDGVYSLTHTHLAFDSMNVNGDIHLDTKPEKLKVTGHVSIDRLDINPYLAPGADDDTVKANKAKAANPDARMELGGLKALNADLTLILGGLVLPQGKLNQAVVKALLEDGVLKADLTSVTAYGGTGKGSLTVDASGDVPVFHQTLEMNGINVQPFLTEMMGVSRITGKGAVRYDLTARGDTTKAIVKDLSGKGEIRFVDGNIAGVDLVEVARVVQSVLMGDVLRNAIGNDSKTAFAKMGASFTIAHGVMHTNDLQLVNPVVEMSGQGDVDLSQHVLDFHFEPKAVRGIPGLKLVDIGVPFYVKGPWEKPRFEPDARGIAKTIVNKLQNGAATPFDLLTKPGPTLKSLFGSENRPSK